MKVRNLFFALMKQQEMHATFTDVELLQAEEESKEYNLHEERDHEYKKTLYKLVRKVDPKQIKLPFDP